MGKLLTQVTAVTCRPYHAIITADAMTTSANGDSGAETSRIGTAAVYANPADDQPAASVGEVTKMVIRSECKGRYPTSGLQNG